MRRDKILQAAEALAFTAAVAAYIWFLRAQSSWTLLALLAFVVVSFVAHAETPASLGLNWGTLLHALTAWRWTLAAAAAAMAILAIVRTVPPHLAWRWFVYLAWCILQQLLFQNMVYRRLRSALGSSWKTSLCAGALFAATHLPNPILVPATFAWGTLSTRLFESRPSIPFLGLCQALLSMLVYLVTPVELNHLFRVGPGYWRW